MVLKRARFEDIDNIKLNVAIELEESFQESMTSKGKTCNLDLKYILCKFVTFLTHQLLTLSIMIQSIKST